MKVLVTGGAGFIGYNLSRALLDRGDSVVIIDNLSDYYDVTLKRARLQQLEGFSGYSFHQIDICDYEALVGIVSNEGFDCIVHLAALAGVLYASEHGHEYVRTNVEGTFSLLELARRKGIPKVVFASSSSVYGDTNVFPSDESLMTDSPASLYAATKKSDELLAYTYRTLYGIQTVGLRFFNVYGPWGRPDSALFIFTKGIIEGSQIDVYNHGKTLRDFTYIDDIVDGIVRSIAYEGNETIFNLGYGKNVELIEYITTIERSVGKQAIMNLMPKQDGDLPVSLSSIDRARTELGYEPKTSVEVGIPRFVQWYRDYYHL